MNFLIGVTTTTKISVEWILGMLFTLGAAVLVWVIKLEVNRAVSSRVILDMQTKLEEGSTEFKQIRVEFKVVETALSEVKGQNNLQAQSTEQLMKSVEAMSKAQNRLIAMIYTLNPSLKIHISDENM